MRTLTALYLLSVLTALPCAGMRPMVAGDPNLDPAWNWMAKDRYELFSKINRDPVRQELAFLPYLTDGNPLKTFLPPDGYPEDGWMLVHRDFGIPGDAPAFPFFTLYNRYRGLFRVMLYNAANREGSYFLGELTFLNGESDRSARAPLMTHVEVTNTFLNQYNPSTTLTAMSKMTAYAAWAVFDFPLLGYDPDLASKDPILHFKLISIEKQEIALKSNGNIQLSQTLHALDDGEEAHPAKVQSLPSLGSTAQHAVATYKSVNAFVKNEILSDAAAKAHTGDPWFASLRKFASSPTGSFIPYAAAMASVLESFVGGANKASAWEPLNFTGQLQFDTLGELRTRLELWDLSLLLNPGPQEVGRGQRPLQKVPWGLYNFVELPMISATSDHGVVTVKLVRGPDLVLNPESGLDLTGTRVAFVQTERDGSTTASPFMTPDQAKAQGHSFTMTHETNQFSHLLWEFRFRTRHATLHADPEIVVMKKITPLTAPIAGWDPGALFGHPYGPAPTLPGLNEYQPSSASGSASASR